MLANKRELSQAATVCSCKNVVEQLCCFAIGVWHAGSSGQKREITSSKNLFSVAVCLFVFLKTATGKCVWLLMAGTLATMNVDAWVCFIEMQRHTENEQEGSRNANKSGIPVSTRIRGRYSGDTIVCRVQRHFVCYFLSNNTRCARVSNDMPTTTRVGQSKLCG